jgi:hypothetical protein
LSDWRCALLLAALSGCSSGDIVVGLRDASVAEVDEGAAIPVGIANVNGSALRAAEQVALLRFVPKRNLEIDRVYFGFKLRGASCWDAGGAENGGGDGGLLRGRLVEIDTATGLPGVSIDEETVEACTRHAEAETETGATPVLAWLNLRAQLAGGKMYGLLVQNAHAEPDGNFFSFQTPIADAQLAGPQSRNELDPEARGGVMSLDPREHVAWSIDAGKTWLYGAENGEYASFIAEDPAHPATRIPQYGFRLTSGETVAGQPYYAYKTECQDCTLAYAAAPAARRVTVLGGFTAQADGDVGTLTLTNTDTSASGSCTPPRGYGARTCRLAAAVAIAAGDSYTLHASGSVELMRLDESQRALFPDVGTNADEHRAYQPDPAPGTDAKDVPSLWAATDSR